LERVEILCLYFGCNLVSIVLNEIHMQQDNISG
jgi:hypothetical protein